MRKYPDSTKGFGDPETPEKQCSRPESTLNARAPRNRQKEIHGLRTAIGKSGAVQMRGSCQKCNVKTGMWITGAGYD